MLEIEMKPQFRKLLIDSGFKIVQDHPNLSPDFIVEKDRKKIGIELKGSRPGTDLATGLGQLLLAKFKERVDEMWLVIPIIPLETSRDWVELLNHHQVTVFIFEKGFIRTLDSSQLRRKTFKEFSEIEKEIATVLSKHPDGITIVDIAEAIDVDAGTVRSHISLALKPIEKSPFESTLKRRIAFDGKKIKLTSIPTSTQENTSFDEEPPTT